MTPGEPDPDPFLVTGIGNTPLVRLRRVVPDGAGEVWLKLESGNPTGSYKDRMAVTVIGRALERGDLGPGDRVVEYTGGSTGTALAFVAARSGLRMVAVSSDAFAEAKLASMRAYGAEVIVLPSDGGAITPELIAAMRDRAMELADEPGSFYADQSGSPDVRAGYRRMGAEIARQSGRNVDLLCAGVGTGGPHRVEGIGVGSVPPFLDRDRCAEVRAVDQERAIGMARRLAAEEGLLGGTSTGLNVCAAIDLATEAGAGTVVVTLGVDHGLKYLGGDLFG